MEYTITAGEQYWCNGHWTRDIQFAQRFKSRLRAQQQADTIAVKTQLVVKVEPFWGAPVKGTKQFVMPKQSPINKRSCYRSI